MFMHFVPTPSNEPLFRLSSNQPTLIFHLAEHWPLSQHVGLKEGSLDRRKFTISLNSRSNHFDERRAPNIGTFFSVQLCTSAMHNELHLLRQCWAAVLAGWRRSVPKIYIIIICLTILLLAAVGCPCHQCSNNNVYLLTYALPSLTKTSTATIL